jgi:hypothetical protein
MGLLRMLARGWLINRLFGRGARRRSRGGGYGYGSRPARYGYGRSPRRGRVGMFGPIPYYSTRTRGGSRVSVGGCCLPIPLAVAVSLGVGLRTLLRR